MAHGLPSTLPGGYPAIGDLVRTERPTFSFEFFPPKTDEGERQLWKAIRELEPLRPSFVSITYGAGGSTRDNTVAATERVATDTTLLPMAHLTAVNHSVAELRNVIGRLAAVGVRNILAVRGDPPGDPMGEWLRHPTGVGYAEDLVRLVRESGDFSVGVAAFPYKHPRSPDIDSDTKFFVQKCRAGADFAITQMFFDADEYLRLRDRVAAAGGDVPVLAGVMPVTQIGTIERSQQLSGAPFPTALAAQFERVAGDPSAVRELGIEQASDMCARLLREGVPGIHFITLNRSTATREVWQNLALGSGLIDGDAGADRPGWDDYAARWAALHGGVDPRQSGGATRSWVRLSYSLGRGLARTGLAPDTITVAGVVVSAAVPVVVLFGGWGLFVAAALVLLSAIADSVDGAVAVLTARTSRLGAFSDAMADRVSEAAWLLALWLYGVPGILVAVCGAIAWLHEYARAKAAAAGMRGVGVVTVAERPTRVILVIVALLLGGFAAPYSQRLAAGAMTVVVSLWAVLGLLAAARLYNTIRAALGAR